MSVSKAAFPFLLPLVLAAGCDRGAGHAAAPAEIASAPSAAPAPPPAAEPHHHPSSRESAPPPGPVAVAQAPANEKAAPRPAVAPRPPRAPVERPSAVPPGAAAPGDEHAHHDHPEAHAAPAKTGESTAAGGDAPDVVYTCPMHPDVKSKTPGRCPECGMDLVPKKP